MAAFDQQPFEGKRDPRWTLTVTIIARKEGISIGQKVTPFAQETTLFIPEDFYGLKGLTAVVAHKDIVYICTVYAPLPVNPVQALKYKPWETRPWAW